MLSVSATLPPVDDSDDSRPGSAAANAVAARTSATAASVFVAREAPAHLEAILPTPPPEAARRAAYAAGKVFVEVIGTADEVAASADGTAAAARAPGKQPPAVQMRHSAAHIKSTGHSSRAASVVSWRACTVAGRAAKHSHTRIAGEIRVCSGAAA